MILIDPVGHMVSTESAQELHTFAERIGVRKENYTILGISKKEEREVTDVGAHYSLDKRVMLYKALRMGAIMKEPKELLNEAWWAKKDDWKQNSEMEMGHSARVPGVARIPSE